MNKEIKQKWVEALRSGKYTQGRNRLASSNGSYCPLGVLCELAVEADVAHKRQAESGYVYFVRFDNSVYFAGSEEAVYSLPDRVVDWAGLSSNNPWIDTPTHRGAIAHLNDNAGFSFDEIANGIEVSL